MNLAVGTKVAFDRNDATISNHACGAFGFDFINDLKFFDCKFHKGVVTKVKTHSWFFFKLKNPVYMVDDYYLVEKVKPIQKAYAGLRKVYNKGEKLESVWEMTIT